jgi:hypothetical protein
MCRGGGQGASGKPVLSVLNVSPEVSVDSVPGQQQVIPQYDDSAMQPSGVTLIVFSAVWF